MSSAHLPAPLGDPNRPVVASSSLPPFMAKLSAYQGVLNGTPGLELVNACIHQLEERKELLKKERDNEDARAVWKQSQAASSMNSGLAGVFTFATAVLVLLRTHLPSWSLAIVLPAAVIVLMFQLVVIGMSWAASANSTIKPNRLEKKARKLGRLLSSFRILKDQLEDEAARQAQDTSRLTGSDSAGLVDRRP